MARFLNTESLSSTYGGLDTDWQENEDSHIFKFDIPGCNREDVTIQIVDNDTLQVSGIRKDGSPQRFGKWHVKERPDSAFIRKFQLPTNIKVNEISAYDERDGVLVIVVPKRKTFIRDIPISKF